MKMAPLKTVLNILDILWRSLKKFNSDNGFFLSSGIAFNILVNLIPLIMLLLALLGTYLYSDQQVLDQIRAYFRNLAPTLDPKIMESLTNIIRDRQIVGVLGFAGLLWFSTWVFGSLRVAFNIVFRVERNRGMLPGIGLDLLMILLAGTLLLLSMVLSSGVAFIQGFQGRASVAIGPTLQWTLKYLLPFLLTLCMFFLIYRILPYAEIHMENALKAAVFTGLLWESAKHLFSWYIAHLAEYSVFYGSLSTLIVFVLWVYYSSIVVVLGAEITYFLEKDKLKDAGTR